MRYDTLVFGACDNQVVLPDLCHENGVSCSPQARCALMLADCDFEQKDMCGWTNVVDNSDDFDWTLHHGSTSTAGTGPSVDHTTNSSSGYFVYIESSKALPGQQAALVSPIFNSTYNGYACTLSFWWVGGWWWWWWWGQRR